MAEKPKDAKISASAAALAAASSSQLDTSKAERRVWMMKCPPVVARAMQSNTHHPPSPLPSDASAGQIFAKVVVAVDPLHPNDDLSSTQVYMCAHLHWKCVSMCRRVALCFSLRFWNFWCCLVEMHWILWSFWCLFECDFACMVYFMAIVCNKMHFELYGHL